MPQVLTGQRRRATHKAGSDVKALSLARDDLMLVFDRNPRAARRIVQMVMRRAARSARVPAQSARRSQRAECIPRATRIGGTCAAQVMGEFERKERLRNLTMKLLLTFTKGKSENMWAALKMQQRWKLYRAKYLTVAPTFPDVVSTPAEIVQAQKIDEASKKALAEVKGNVGDQPIKPDANRAAGRDSVTQAEDGEGSRAAGRDSETQAEGGEGALSGEDALLRALEQRIMSAVEGELKELRDVEGRIAKLVRLEFSQLKLESQLGRANAPRDYN